MTDVAAALLVIHDAGDEKAGSGWSELVAAWPGAALAPDLPGHGETPPPTGAHYKAGDAAIAAWRAAEHAGIPTDAVVVLGHGWGGFAAEVLAAAGRASRLVLVDGLGPPWCDVDALVADRHRWLREVLADPGSLAPPAGAPDPRLAHAFPSIWDRAFIGDLRRSIRVPVLAVETPASPTPPAERDERLGAFSGGATLAQVDSPGAAAVVDALRREAWLQP
ncbi:MAG: alpha/beta hydrolase [Acidimicrobiia bacterium]|nr:alpha/beta hydrolase [Acidimicrobiia bacterium]